MVGDEPTGGLQLRRSDNNERFVAFAFAAADLLAEIDAAGIITYAAGAYRTRFGNAPEEWTGRHLFDMVVPADHEALSQGLVMLAERGRLMPWMGRLANSQKTEVAIAGLRLAPEGRPVRMCVTFALPPSPIVTAAPVKSAQALARATEARMRAGLACEMGLLQIDGSGADTIRPALEALAPDSLASEIAPGRFGLLGPSANGPSLVNIAASLETLLRDQGVAATVSSHQLPLDNQELTQRQTARALRQALDAFSRDGITGLSEGGFEGGLASYIQGAMEHAGAMRRAISERRFELVYQPIMKLGSREMHHVEALIRPAPVPGCPANTPQDFVVLAETVGLASELDLAVASMACEAAVRSTVPVAFNLSGQSMQDPVFRDRLVAKLINHPARKSKKLAVEMTETAQLEDIAEAAQTAQVLRDMGIPFCLDDFGAGAADVRVLRAMPADIVKLDGSYVSGIVADGRERAFVTGMVEIARASGASVVAERVETEAEAQALQAIGVDYGQGWLFGRPGALPLPATVPVRRRTGQMQESWG